MPTDEYDPDHAADQERELMETTMTEYTALQPIKAYEAPQYLVQPFGNLLRDQWIVDEVFEYADEVSCLDQNLVGWEGFHEVIKVTYFGDSDRYYLARIAEIDPEAF